jgi:hypothetical protein
MLEILGFCSILGVVLLIGATSARDDALTPEEAEVLLASRGLDAPVLREWHTKAFLFAARENGKPIAVYVNRVTGHIEIPRCCQVTL